MEPVIVFKNMLNTVVYSLLGLVILWFSFIAWDRLTPGNLWKEIVEEKNVALAIATGAFTIAMAHIIASAVHG